jgi:malate dehydrogenase (oxaloacetate-decarboxylating)(NADP+)
MERLGARRENLTLVDVYGVVYQGRTVGMDPNLAPFAAATSKRTLAEAIEGADVFLGCSAGGIVSQEMIRSMAARPIVFALANPDPEIAWPLARAAAPEAIVATGRSDFPNQVNNVLGFPSIFRGALDVRAREINEAMELAATRALARLAREPVPELVSQAYGGERFCFGPDYLLPKPLDPRVVPQVASAVAAAAIETGVAASPVEPERYRASLEARFAPKGQPPT